MSRLTEEDFWDIKEELKDGRLSPDSVRFYLGVFMFVSLIFVGIAFTVVSVSDSVIGWTNLSVFWKSIFWLQGILFILQLILIFLVNGKSNWKQVLLNISYVIFTYKVALDPLIMTLMFAKNDGVYEQYAPLALAIIIFGFGVHFYLIRRKFSDLKPKKKKKKEKNWNVLLYTFIPVLFLLVSVTGYIFKHDLLGDDDILFLLGVDLVILTAILIGAVEFVLGAYCLIRFPSFRVNPPSSKKNARSNKA